MNGENHWPLRAGMSCGSAFQTKRSWTNVGTARKIQMYPKATTRTSAQRLSRMIATTRPISRPAIMETTVRATVIWAPSTKAREVRASKKIDGWKATFEPSLQMRPARRRDRRGGVGGSLGGG